MDRVKRGLVSLTVLLLGSALLYLLYSLSLYANASTTLSSDLLKFEGANARYDSASYGMSSILSHLSVNVTVDGQNISFKQNLSTNNNSYQQDLSSFKQFIESRNSVYNLSVNLTNASNPLMLVHPQEIVADNLPGLVSFTPQNSVLSSGDVLGYDLLIRSGSPTPLLNWTTISTLSQSDPNAMYFHIGFQGSNGTVSYSTYLDKYSQSELHLLGSSNQSLFTVQTGSPAFLKFYYSTNASLETIVILNSSTSVELGANIINVSVSQGFENIGKVILGES